MTDDGREQRLVRGSWAGWKLDVAHALAFDPALKASDVRVAVAMLRFVRSVDLTLYPSQERLCSLTSMGMRNLRDCLDRLRTAGWIAWDRGNRQLANVYRFNADHVADQLARVKLDEAEHRAKRKARKPLSERQHSAGQIAASDVQYSAARDRQYTATQPLNRKVSA